MNADANRVLAGSCKKKEAEECRLRLRYRHTAVIGLGDMSWCLLSIRSIEGYIPLILNGKGD